MIEGYVYKFLVEKLSKSQHFQKFAISSHQFAHDAKYVVTMYVRQRLTRGRRDEVLDQIKQSKTIQKAVDSAKQSIDSVVKSVSGKIK